MIYDFRSYEKQDGRRFYVFARPVPWSRVTIHARRRRKLYTFERIRDGGAPRTTRISFVIHSGGVRNETNLPRITAVVSRDHPRPTFGPPQPLWRRITDRLMENVTAVISVTETQLYGHKSTTDRVTLYVDQGRTREFVHACLAPRRRNAAVVFSCARSKMRGNRRQLRRKLDASFDDA